MKELAQASPTAGGEGFPAEGRARVVIDHVTPVVDGGQFPAKAIAGDPVNVRAHIFADGHDLISGLIQFRPQGSDYWREEPLWSLPNDEWEGSFTPDAIGYWEFNVVAWIDHFASWRAGLAKKREAGQPLGVELEIGALMVDEAVTRAGPEFAERLKECAAGLRDETVEESIRADFGLGEELAGLMRAHPDRTLASSAPVLLPLFVDREKAACSTWYEFFPRSWGEKPGQHGTLRSAMAILPEIARMGFDVVYLPPIHPIGRNFRKGKNNSLTPAPEDVGSPWAIGSEEGGHTAIHPQLGTLEDFRAFTWRVGELGMEVALDIAFQCSPDHPWVKEHPQWFRWRPDGTVQYAENPPKKYQDILPIHFETYDWQNLWRALRDVFLFWVDQGVKIFRVDNPHTKAMDFWRWCIESILHQHPDVIFLAEAFTRPKRKYRLAKAGFTQGYTYFTWRQEAAEMREYVEELTSPPVCDFFRPNFWPNTPDILHAELQSPRPAAFRARYLLAATLSSNIGIYGPAFELMEYKPFPGKEEYVDNEKYEIKQWDWDRPGNLKPFLTRVNQLRRQFKALQRTNNITFVNVDNASLLAFVKTSPGADSILVIVNMDYDWAEMGWLDLPLEKLGLGDEEAFVVEDLLADPLPAGHPVIYPWRGRRNFVKLDPAIAVGHVFRIVKGRKGV